MRVHFNRIADIAKVDRFHLVGLRVGHFGNAFSNHQIGIFAGDANGLAALAVDGRDDFLVDLAGEHHFDDFDGCLVGNAQAVHEIGFDIEPLQQIGDLRSAAMDDDGIDSRLLQINDVLGKSVGQGLIAHGVASELNHDGLLVVSDEVGDCFCQNARLEVRCWRVVCPVGDLLVGVFWRFHRHSSIGKQLAGSMKAGREVELRLLYRLFPPSQRISSTIRH